MLRCVYANETVPHTHVLVWLKIQRRTWRPGRWFKERATVNVLKSRNICDICEPVEARDLRMTLNSTHDQLHIKRGTIHQVIPEYLWKSVICAKFVSQSHGWPWPVNQTPTLFTWSHASRRPSVHKVKSTLKGRRYQDAESIKKNVTAELRVNTVSLTTFNDWFYQLLGMYIKCVEVKGS